MSRVTFFQNLEICVRGCVAYNDLWPWPIFSRSFGLDLENCVRSVASTVLDGFFPYLVQMITSMRRCVACDDFWPWPISSRSFDLDFENRARSVTFSVRDRLFPYLPQITTTIRGCVACEVYNKFPKFQFFANFSNFSVSRWKKIYSSAYILSIFFLLGIWYESIVWVIMGRWGYSQNAGILLVLVLFVIPDRYLNDQSIHNNCPRLQLYEKSPTWPCSVLTWRQSRQSNIDPNSIFGQ